MGMFNVGNRSSKPIKVTVGVAEGQPLTLEVDTGSAKTIIPKEVYFDQYEVKGV